MSICFRQQARNCTVWLGCLSILGGMGSIPAWTLDGRSVEAPLARVFEPSSSWSVVLAEAESGRVVYSQNAREPRMPASNLKVYVTTAAFDALGSRFRYRTPLMGFGQLDRQGTWNGHLLARGSGDPTFSGRFEENPLQITGALDRWAHRLREMGIQRVTGDLYGHDDIFDEDLWVEGWPKDAWCDWYTAPSGGLILNDSCLDVGVYPSRPGSPPMIKKFPDTGYIEIANKAITTGKGSSTVSLRRSFEANDLRLFGKVSTRTGPTQHTVAITDPTGYFIHVLKEVLEQHGIHVEGRAGDADTVADIPKRGWRVLAWNESPRLVDLARVINTRSQNLFADSLLKTIGARRSGTGSWSSGELAVKDYVASLGIPVDPLRIQDGSGLSRLNRVTAEDTLQLLLKVQREPWFHDWKSTLAVSGASEGSLRKRLKGPLLEGKVFAKTGFIDDVYALSGYVESKGGRTYAFCMLFNGTSHAGKHPHQRMEEALTLLARDEP